VIDVTTAPSGDLVPIVIGLLCLVGAAGIAVGCSALFSLDPPAERPPAPRTIAGGKPDQEDTCSST
jgi:hypothetical protein